MDTQFCIGQQVDVWVSHFGHVENRVAITSITDVITTSDGTVYPLNGKKVFRVGGKPFDVEAFSELLPVD